MDFVPPFCPRKDCPTHLETSGSSDLWFARRGFRSTKAVGRVQKFQCRRCQAHFCERTFSIDYWTHRHVDYQLIQDLLVGGSGLRQACRALKVSTRLLANRHVRLARQALVLQARAFEELTVKESLVLDGFESFAYSQYYPNNLNLLVTSESQLLLGLTGTVLRRKGKMTSFQKRKRSELETVFRAQPNGIYRSCQRLFRYGCDLSLESRRLPIEVHTDEKKEYGWALRRLSPYGEWMDHGLLWHSTTSSKAPRTRQNPLFPVNYLDRQLRKDLAEHVRETVRFARRLEYSLERAVIHLAHHNFRKRYRSRTGEAELTHAEVAGLERARVQDLVHRSFVERAFPWRCQLEEWQTRIWNRCDGVPVHPCTPLAKHFHAA